MTQHIKRILVYTHNSIGLGHAFRTLAVITGIRKWRPDINFLVLSSTSIPQIFFNEGIEVVKLPSVKLDIDQPGDPMCPRYLHDLDIESIFDFRQRIILETHDFFKPDVLMVEHNMTGQMSELIPLLMKKWMRQGGPADFALIHVCRGIMKWVPLLKIPYQNPRHRSESINIGALYDYMYVLEDRDVIDINKAFLGDDPELEKKIRYLGKVTHRVFGELASREETLGRFCLPDEKIALISLGRNSRVVDLTLKLLKIFSDTGIDRSHRIVVVNDTYLPREAAQTIENNPAARNATFLSFVPRLVDLAYHSDLIVCRAGYNTVNEVLLTGTKAVFIPESHGSGEQEQRVQHLPQENIIAATEGQVMDGTLTQDLVELVSQPKKRASNMFDKYAVGKSIIEDLEEWTARKRARNKEDG